MCTNVMRSLPKRLFFVVVSTGGWRRWPDRWSDFSGALVVMSDQLTSPKGHFWCTFSQAKMTNWVCFFFISAEARFMELK